MTRNNEFSICQCACFEERKIGNFVITQKQKKCPKGFSELQIMILSILKSYDDVLTYSQLTGAVNSNFGLEVTETSVRGAVERLAKKKIFAKKHIRSGAIQGNKYTFKGEPCEFIKAFTSKDASMDSTSLVTHNEDNKIDEYIKPKSDEAQLEEIIDASIDEKLLRKLPQDSCEKGK